MSKYDDILYLPHHVSDRHDHMPLSDRAAQFAPFAALTGYDDVIVETGRHTESHIELDESRKYELDIQLRYLMEIIDSQPAVTVRYFQADARKVGGSYITLDSCLKKINELERSIVLVDGTVIPIDNIVGLICSQH